MADEDFNSVLSDVKQTAQPQDLPSQPQAPALPVQSGLTEDSVALSLDAKQKIYPLLSPEIQQQINDTKNFFGQTSAGRILAAMGHAEAEASKQYSTPEPLATAGAINKSAPINGEIEWQNTINKNVVRPSISAASFAGEMGKKALELGNIAYAPLLAGLNQVGLETGSTAISDMADEFASPEMMMILHQAGGIHATAESIKDTLAKPAYPDEIARGVHNGVFEPSDPAIKAEAAQQIMAQNPVDYASAISEANTPSYGKYDRWIRESEQRIKQGEKPSEPPITEEGEPETDIHQVARTLEPETFKEYDDLINQRTWYADTMREQAEKRPVIEPDADKMKALDDQIAPLQAKVDTELAKVNGVEERLTKTKAAAIADAREQISNLQSQQDALKLEAEKVSKAETPDMAALRKKYEEINKKLSDIADTGKIRNAYIKAQKFLPEKHEIIKEETPVANEKPVAEPEKAATQESPKEQGKLPLPQPAIDIAGDVEKQAVKAGYSPEAAKETAALHASFFDTLAKIYPEMGSATELYHKYGADVTKSNRGTKTQGKVKLSTDNARAIITLMKSADASTFLHESGHLFLDVLDRISKEKGAPDRIKNDMATARDWMGIPQDADLRAVNEKGRYLYRDGLEKFARGFERYLMEGTAPSRELAGVFAKFKTWLTDVYKSVVALKVHLSPEIKSVFDRMLAVNPEHQTIIASERTEANAPEKPTFNVTPPESKKKPKNEEPSVPISEAASPILKAKEPMRLTDYIKKLGGVNDEGGDLASMIGDKKEAKKLINEKGIKIDDLVEKAWKDGYFPEFAERPTIDEFKERLGHDLRGNAQYSHNDIHDVQKYLDVQAHNEEVNRVSNELGISIIGKSYNEFWNEVAEKLSAQEQEKFIADKEASAQKEFEDAEKAREEHFADIGHKYETKEPATRTLEDLENEWKQEESARNMEQGTSTGAEQPAARDEGTIQQNSADSGIGVEPSRRTSKEGAEPRGNGSPSDTNYLKDGALNPNLIKNEEDLRRGIKQAIEDQKAGEKTFKDTARRALPTMLSPDQVKNLWARFKDIVDTPEELPIAVQTALDSLALAEQDMEKYGENFTLYGNDADYQKFWETLERQSSLTDIVTGAKRMGGLTLRTFHENAEEVAKSEALAELFQRTGRSKEETLKLIQTIRDMNNKSKVTKLISDVQKNPTATTALCNFAVLSGWASHAGNITGMLARIPALAIESEIKGVMNLKRYFGGEDSGARIGQGVRGLARVVQNAPTIIHKTGTAILEGKQVALPGENIHDISQDFAGLKKTLGFDAKPIADKVNAEFNPAAYPDIANLSKMLSDTKASVEAQKQAAIAEGKIPRTKTIEAQIQKGEFVLSNLIASEKMKIFNKELLQKSLETKGIKEYQDSIKSFGQNIGAAFTNFRESRSKAKLIGRGLLNAPAAIGKGATNLLYAAPHTLMTEISRFQRMDEHANTIAAREGYKGDDLKTRAKQLLDNPTQEMLDLGIKEARYTVFQNSSNAYSKFTINIRNALDKWTWHVPFTDKVIEPQIGSKVMPIATIPATIAHQIVVDYSLFGLASKAKRGAIFGNFEEGNFPEIKEMRDKIEAEPSEYKKASYQLKLDDLINDKKAEFERTKSSEQETAQARQAIGLLVGGIGVYLLNAGLATPSAGKSAKEEQAKDEAGRPSGSIKIGDTWYDTSKIAVIGRDMQAYIDIAAMIGQGVTQEQHYSMTDQIFNASNNFLFKEDALQNLSDMYEACRGNKKTFAENFIASRMVPLAVKQYAQKDDPTEYVAHNFGEMIRKELPTSPYMRSLAGLDALQPRIDPYTGEPMQKETMGITTIRTHTGEPNTNAEELLNLGMSGISNPPPVIHGVQLTPEEETNYNIIHGHLMANGMDYLFKGDAAAEYQAASPQRKKEMFEKVRNFVSKAAQSILLFKNPDLLQRINDHIEGLPDDVRKPSISTPYSSEDDISFAQ